LLIEKLFENNCKPIYRLGETIENYQSLGSVIRLALDGKKNEDKTFFIETVNISYTTDNKYSTCDLSKLNPLLANQILSNCKSINQFFNLIEVLPYEYSKASLRPTATKSYHALRDRLSIVSEHFRLSTNIDKFKDVIFKEIGKNAMMLKKYSSYLPKEEVDNCLKELKKNQVRVKNDPMLINHLFSIHGTKFSEIGLNSGVEV